GVVRRTVEPGSRGAGCGECGRVGPRTATRRDFQAMIDRHDEGSAVGSDLLGSSDRLFHWWHKYRDGETAWSTFLGYARPIRWGIRQALGRGAACASEKTAATCRMLLEGEKHLWTFLRVQGIEPTNN